MLAIRSILIVASVSWVKWRLVRKIVTRFRKSIFGIKWRSSVYAPLRRWRLKMLTTMELTSPSSGIKEKMNVPKWSGPHPSKTCRAFLRIKNRKSMNRLTASKGIYLRTTASSLMSWIRIRVDGRHSKLRSVFKERSKWKISSPLTQITSVKTHHSRPLKR